jgi:hypothetical protein
VKVGRLVRGGWGGKLDIVAYNPQTNHLVHIEPSLFFLFGFSVRK